VPAGETRVLKQFQERMPYGLIVMLRGTSNAIRVFPKPSERMGYPRPEKVRDVQYAYECD
jgi:hypothetical protein